MYAWASMENNVNKPASAIPYTLIFLQEGEEVDWDHSPGVSCGHWSVQRDAESGLQVIKTVVTITGDPSILWRFDQANNV